MSQPIRVAQIVGNMTYGGVSQVVMNYYRKINREKIQFDFFVYENSINPFKDEILSMGGNIYLLPSIKHIFQFNKTLKDIFKKNNYQIVHSHISTLSVIPLRIAKKCDVPTRIAHSHSTANIKEPIRSLFKYILRPLNKIYANEYFACGEYAGRWMFGKKAIKNNKVFIMRNGIDLDKFKFNEEDRNELRNKYNIQDKLVLGFVGRIVKQKNPLFLVELLNKQLTINPNTILMIIGDGELKQSLTDKATSYDILEKVIFVEPNKEVYKYYSAMDVFLLPSLYEGLPVVMVESQSNGLPTIISDNITSEIVYNENCVRIELKINDWLEQINSLTRTTINTNINEYNINLCINRLENKYNDLVDNL